MPRRANLWIDILMARHAGIRAHVKAVQVAHSGSDAVRVGVIRPGVGANPIFRGPVAAFTRNALRHCGIVPQPLSRDGGKWRMAYSATRALGRVSNLEHFRKALGARGFERRVGPRVMKIVRRPDGELFALFACAAVATAGTAGL